MLFDGLNKFVDIVEQHQSDVTFKFCIPVINIGIFLGGGGEMSYFLNLMVEN